MRVCVYTFHQTVRNIIAFMKRHILQLRDVHTVALVYIVTGDYTTTYMYVLRENRRPR